MRSMQRQAAGELPVIRTRPVAITAALALLALAGCDSLTKNDQLPTDVTDPAITQTPQGALQVYRGVVAQFRGAFGDGFQSTELQVAVPTGAVAVGGELSDELQYANLVFRDDILTKSPVDRRNVPADGVQNDANTLAPYGALQKVRGQASQAIGLLQDYLPDSVALRGHAYALAGYAEVFLAELFCSGIPLSTLDYKGNYTPQPGSSTADVFAHAAALFDSTLAYAGDNPALTGLARVGKARALLGLGDYTQAAATAGLVADDYAYPIQFFVLETGQMSGSNLFGPNAFVNGAWVFSVADREGVNGLDYISSGDPRTAVQAVNARQMPAKYAPFDGGSPIVLASGLEARLIEAEAALRTHPDDGAWLATLNALRTDGTADPATTVQDTLGLTGCDPQHLCGADGVTGGTFQLPPGATLASSTALDLSDKPELQQECVSGSTYAPCSESPAHTTVNVYTVPPQWHAGTGQVAGLAPLSDPGTPDGRVDLLFRERAFWLFLTGHRLGDLRRLIRPVERGGYGRNPEAVYPTGLYYRGGFLYGSTVALPIPNQERQTNPLFTGCASGA